MPLVMNETPDSAHLPIQQFMEQPTHDLSAWQDLWERDREFPIRSHRGWIGRLVVALKRLLRPLVKGPQADLWERQSAFNTVLLAHLEALYTENRNLARDLEQVRSDLIRDLRQVRDDLDGDIKVHHGRLVHLESFKRDGLQDVMRHSDALYSILDQKLDRYRQSLGRARAGDAVEDSGPQDTGSADDAAS